MMEIHKQKRKTFINLFCGIVSIIISTGISFFLSPYIVREIGVEAHGFVGLANNLVGYANLIVTALNAMAARFITIAYIQKDYKRANLYYNSVFWGNLILCGILLLPAFVLIIRLELLFDIPNKLLTDVKILFSMIFLSFFVRTGAPNWDCGTYISNRLDRNYVPNMILTLFRCFFLILVFGIFSPHIWYISLASAIVTLLSLAIAGYNTHTLTPELKIQLTHPICSYHAIKELVGAGIWSSIAIGGNSLLNSLDLLICNKYLGASLMGILSLSKSIPGIVTELAETIRGTFGPELTISYAEGGCQGMLEVLKRSIKTTTVLITIPVGGLIAFGTDFYNLWLPTQDAKLLNVLTILSILSLFFSSGINVLNSVFVTLNKVRYNAIALLVTGSVSLLLTLLAIQKTDWDLYAVAGVSSVVMIARDLLYMIPLVSKFIGVKWTSFVPDILHSMFCIIIISLIGFFTKRFFSVDTWIGFLGAAGVVASIGLIANMFIILNREERKNLLQKIRGKLFLC